MTETLINGMIKPPCSVTLGADLLTIDVENESIEMSFLGTEDFITPRGSVQGGFVAAMLDELLALVIIAVKNGSHIPITLDLNVSYLRPVMPGKIWGTGKIIQMGRTMAFVEAELHDADKKVLARATSTVKVVERKPK